MKVWITKYALTQGIFEVDGKICTDIDENMISAGKNEFYHNYSSGINEWHRRNPPLEPPNRCDRKRLFRLESRLTG